MTIQKATLAIDSPTTPGVYIWWSNILGCWQVQTWAHGQWCGARGSALQREAIEHAAAQWARQLGLEVYEIEIEKMPLSQQGALR